MFMEIIMILTSNLFSIHTVSDKNFALFSKYNILLIKPNNPDYHQLLEFIGYDAE